MGIWFQKEEMTEILRDFYTLTKLRIVLFDDEFQEIISYPNRHSTYCTILRDSQEVKKACNDCDLQACVRCRKTRKPYMYQCHAGLWETVVPLQYESTVTGYLMFGQVLLEGEETREELWKKVEDQSYDVDHQALKEAFFRKRRIDREKFSAAAKILEACASYLYLSRVVSLQKMSLEQEIEQYVNRHIQNEIRIEELCRECGISRNRLYQVSRYVFGKGIASYIREIRIRNAKELLLSTNEQVCEIARKVGIPDYNYFTKIFRKMTGQTPTQYRKNKERL